jgi:hypothetical protein
MNERVQFLGGRAQAVRVFSACIARFFGGAVFLRWALGALFCTALPQELKAVDREIVSVFDGYIPKNEQADIEAGTSTYDVTDDVHAAIADVNGTGKILYFPGGTYYVGEIVFSGRDYRVETRGVTFRQRTGLTGDRNIHPIITFPKDSSRIRMGDIFLKGNIGDDVDEYSHGIAVLSAKNIEIGNIHAEDIRGDVLYTYGRITSEGDLQYGLVTGVISGKNIFRCIVAMAGGEANIEGIVQLGPVGYRTFDAEPNAEDAYQPVVAKIGFIQGAMVQVTSDNLNTLNKKISIGLLDLDGGRISNTSPAYPSYAGRNAIALSVNRTEVLEIGRLVLRNYDGYPVQLSDRWGQIRIGILEFYNSNTVDRTYKTIVLQRGAAGNGILSIDQIKGVLAGPDRFAIRSDVGFLKVDLGRVEVAGGAFGAYLTGRVGKIVQIGGLSHRETCVGCEDLSVGTE